MMIGGAEALMRQDLHSYASPLLLRHLCEPGVAEGHCARTLAAAVAAIDVTGFTALAEGFSNRGATGVEELAALIDGCFGSLVDTIVRYGGIAHTFPGDSVIAVWPADRESIGEATRYAVGCAAEAIAAADRLPGALPLKGGVGSGSITTAPVGGVHDRWEFLLTGEALRQMGQAERRARPGELVLSDPAWRLIAAHASARETRQGYVILKSLRPCGPLRPSAPPPVPDSAAPLHCYLPDGLLVHLDSGPADWLGEFRRLSIMLVQLRPRPGEPLLEAELVHVLMRTIQATVYRYGGGIVQLSDDDKGVVVLASMGLPGMTHEHDAERAARAAISIQRELDSGRVRCRVGVATGRIFCGTLGNRERREYRLVGSTVNLASRLMERARDGVLCDAATAALAGPAVAFEGPTPLRLRGLTETVSAFRPLRPPPARADPVARGHAPAPVSPMVGRKRERSLIGSWVARLGPGGVLVIRGEAGIGKSLLASHLVGCVRECGMTALLGFCDPLNATVAYHPWRRVLERLLGIHGVEDETERRMRALARIRQVTNDTELAPLLNAALPLGIPETATSELMSGTVRRSNVLSLLSRLIEHAAEKRGEEGSALVVVLEDVHWMDSASWELIDQVRRSTPNLSLRLAVTMRSVPTPDLPLAQPLLEAEGTILVDLDLLPEADTRELVQGRLRVEHVSAELMGLVLQRTRGNPFFCEELLAVMREAGLIDTQRGVARLLTHADQNAHALMPDSVSAVLSSRIDRLPPPLQLTLKAASVIGEPIELGLLQAIHPMGCADKLIEGHLDKLVSFGLLRCDTPGYCFKHSITRDVAYELMLTSQRRQLHRATAEHLEKGASDAFRRTLFHHWRESGEVDKALLYVEAAGSDAMLQGNYQEAVELFEYGLRSRRAAARTEDGQSSAPARWSKQLGEAQVAMGRHTLGRSSLEIALHGLGHPIPGGRLGVNAAIGLQLGRQLAHRLLPRRAGGPCRRPDSVWTMSAEAYEQLGYIYYAAGETRLGIHAALRMLNLSERARASPVLARAYAAMSLSAGVVPLRRLAGLYERAAARTAQELDDPLTQAYVGWISALRAVGEGRWARVEAGAGYALERSERLGDRRLRVMSLTTLASAAYLQGDLDRALERARTLLATAREHGNRLWEAWAWNALSGITQMQGDDDATLAQCQRALDILTEESDRTEEIRASGMLGCALLRLGRPDEALAVARRARDLIASGDLTSFDTYEGLAGVCEVALCLAEAAVAQGGVLPPTLRRDTQGACAAFRRFARVFPVGRPRSGVASARLLVLRGKRRRAARSFETAIRTAAALGMRHECGLAALAAARCELFTAGERRRHLGEALEVLGPSLAREQAEALRADRTNKAHSRSDNAPM